MEGSGYVDILLNGTDPDDDAIRVVISREPERGTLSYAEETG